MHTDISFAVAAPHICNTLPTDVVAASSLSTTRRLLKRFLFKQSYPDIIQLVVLAVVVPFIYLFI